jgi:hypothetical protein
MNKALLNAGLAGLLLAAAVAANADDKPTFKDGPLVKEIRAATVMYKDVAAAEAAGYVATACAAGMNGGAMGIHFVNPGLLFDADGTPNATFDVTTPEVLIYEPLKNGRLRLVGVEYIVFAEQWNAAHPGGESPVLRGQLLNLGGAPNRYRLPAFYELHVWAWKYNPSGTFADWNPNVKCDPYNPGS